MRGHRRFRKLLGRLVGRLVSPIHLVDVVTGVVFLFEPEVNMPCLGKDVDKLSFSLRELRSFFGSVGKAIWRERLGKFWRLNFFILNGTPWGF